MFKFFRSIINKNASSDSNLETIFPKSSEMLEKSSRQWKLLTDEEILKGIEKESYQGNRYKYFFNSKISKDTRKALRQQGYKVEEGTCYNTPLVRVDW